MVNNYVRTFCWVEEFLKGTWLSFSCCIEKWTYSVVDLYQTSLPWNDRILINLILKAYVADVLIGRSTPPQGQSSSISPWGGLEYPIKINQDQVVYQENFIISCLKEQLRPPVQSYLAHTHKPVVSCQIYPDPWPLWLLHYYHSHIPVYNIRVTFWYCVTSANSLWVQATCIELTTVWLTHGWLRPIPWIFPFANNTPIIQKCPPFERTAN